MENRLQDGRPEAVTIGLAQRRAFIADNTSVLAPPLIPEVLLHLAHEAVPIWQKTEEELGEIGLPPPFWAFAWAGGQALSRYILDRPETVRGKRVIDLASGSGLVGIAAIKAGAAHVLAADIDGFALEAIALNASLIMPPPQLCTDNAAMIAWAGAERLALGLSDPLDFAARARWPLDQAQLPLYGKGKLGAKV